MYVDSFRRTAYPSCRTYVVQGRGYHNMLPRQRLHLTGCPMRSLCNLLRLHLCPRVSRHLLKNTLMWHMCRWPRAESGGPRSSCQDAGRRSRGRTASNPQRNPRREQPPEGKQAAPDHMPCCRCVRVSMCQHVLEPVAALGHHGCTSTSLALGLCSRSLRKVMGVKDLEVCNSW